MGLHRINEITPYPVDLYPSVSHVPHRSLALPGKHRQPPQTRCFSASRTTARRDETVAYQAVCCQGLSTEDLTQRSDENRPNFLHLPSKLCPTLACARQARHEGGGISSSEERILIAWDDVAAMPRKNSVVDDERRRQQQRRPLEMVTCTHTQPAWEQQCMLATRPKRVASATIASHPQAVPRVICVWPDVRQG